MRKAFEDYTFADGTFVPKGAQVSTILHSMHRDDARYPNANEFDGFRFFKMAQGKAGGDSENHGDDGGESISTTKYQFPTTSPDFLAFGFGMHRYDTSEFTSTRPFILSLQLPRTFLCRPAAQVDDGTFAIELRCQGTGCPSSVWRHRN